MTDYQKYMLELARKSITELVVAFSASLTRELNNNTADIWIAEEGIRCVERSTKAIESLNRILESAGPGSEDLSVDIPKGLLKTAMRNISELSVVFSAALAKELNNNTVDTLTAEEGIRCVDRATMAIERLSRILESAEPGSEDVSKDVPIQKDHEGH